MSACRIVRSPRGVGAARSLAGGSVGTGGTGSGGAAGRRRATILRRPSGSLLELAARDAGAHAPLVVAREPARLPGPAPLQPVGADAPADLLRPAFRRDAERRAHDALAVQQPLRRHAALARPD